MHKVYLVAVCEGDGGYDAQRRLVLLLALRELDRDARAACGGDDEVVDQGVVRHRVARRLAAARESAAELLGDAVEVEVLDLDVSERVRADHAGTGAGVALELQHEGEDDLEELERVRVVPAEGFVHDALSLLGISSTYTVGGEFEEATQGVKQATHGGRTAGMRSGMARQHGAVYIDAASTSHTQWTRYRGLDGCKRTTRSSMTS
eukprot:3941700-Rhodomonas_salina.2